MRCLPACMLLACLSVSAQEAGQPPVESPAPDPDVETLIRQLADENFQARELATLRIWKLGDKALPALQKAVGSDDPEQAERARKLIYKIDLSITPDTPPAVQTLVERYARAGIQEKLNVMVELRRLSAWRQMLKLHGNEKVAATRETLKRVIDGVAVLAARERIAAGDADGAREFLEMAQADTAACMALVAFHRAQGTLEEAKRQIPGTWKQNSTAWQLAVLRATGEIEAARQLALKSGDHKVAAAMAILAGDPLPWLRGAHADGDEDEQMQIYRSLAIKRWQGIKFQPGDMGPLKRMATHPDESVSTRSINFLFLIGETEFAEATLAKTQPTLAFQHFETLERLDLAHRALGLDPEKPDYPAWFAKRFESYLNPNDEDDEDEDGNDIAMQELYMMANFLERRGQDKMLISAFSKPMAALAKDRPARFTDFLSVLFGSQSETTGSPRLSLAIGAEWAGEDVERWDEVMISAFGEEEDYRIWWEWLGELDPKMKPRERMEAMLALFDYGRDTKNLRDEMLDLAWKAVDKTEKDAKETLLQRIVFISDVTGDVTIGMKARKMMPRDEDDDSIQNGMFIQLSALNRWDETAEIFLQQIARLAESRQSPRPDIHAYAAAALRRAGREEEAKAHDSWADKLALGDVSTSLSIGQGYAFGGDYDRAGLWYERAIRECDPESGRFSDALRYHADHVLDGYKWKEAAACAEVLALLESSRYSQPFQIMRVRMQADLARALSILNVNRPRAISLLEGSHRMFPCDGTLADHFFPALRSAGLIGEHDRWFEESWDQINSVITRYPESDNTMNTAAWLASRANRRLDKAEALLRKALALNPRQAAYLDTMAEVQFARKNREKAVEWSNLSINHSPEDLMIRRQNVRFLKGEFPL